MRRCWRCKGRGHMGKLPGGAFLIDRLCHGSGWLTTPTTRWQRLLAWWADFKERHIIADDPHPDVSPFRRKEGTPASGN